MKKLGVVVTARVKSSRLKEKVLQIVKGKRTIEILLDHVIPQDDAWDVVLAIPESPDDDILMDIGIQKGIEVYRGEDDSPLHRLNAVANKYDFDYIVRITADDILIDQHLLRQQIHWATNGKLDYCYMRRCPEGVAGEVIKTEALEKVVAEIGDQPVEFVSYYFKNDNFTFNEFYPPLEYQWTFRLTMDYEEDLKLIRELYNALPEPFGTLDIINFLKKHRTFCQINELPKVTVYTCNYNQGKFLLDAMRSVHEQTIDDYEYIILDDCSTDDSANVMLEYYNTLEEHYQIKTKMLRNKKNIGLPACCNDILTKARGKYLMRLDADDVLKPDAIKKNLEKMRIERTQGCFSAYHETKEGLSVTSTITKNDFHPAGCVLSKWCVNEIRFREDLEFGEGVPFMRQFRKYYPISFISEPLWLYRKHGESKTANPEHPNNK
jgi:spore coat polysaccharide biosynthesis protein SpsF (cytidylyltransferase family)